MSHQSMSINQILLPIHQPPQWERETKVKVFYTLNGSQKHCLSSFDKRVSTVHLSQKKWIHLPLKECLLSVCSSCPDQLIHQEAAVYSANFEESRTAENWSPLHDATTGIVWEGHGLLSSVMQSNQGQVTGKLVSTVEGCQVEVLIQLEPLKNGSPLPQPMIAHNTNTTHEHQLPPMRSLWNPNQKPTTPPPQLLVMPWGRNEMEKLPSIARHLDPVDYRPWHDPRAPLPQPSTSHSPPPSKKAKHLTPSSTMTIRSVMSVGTTDTYFHQSRRKKRDTKPPNANDIRPFIEVDRNAQGDYALPAEVDSWTVLQLGTVVWDRAAFHNQRYIYPVGYRVKKWYRSMIDPHSDTQYTCEILDGGEEPMFQLNADDNPNECWRGPTPTTVWTIVVRRAFAIRNMDYGHNPVGPDFFGLRKNTIAKMIQDLPNADKCKNYIWQSFEAMNHSKGKSVRRPRSRLGSSAQLKPMEDQSSSSSGSSSPSTDTEA
ncbi:F/Y-rich N-terminus-domain-containing protein [Sporodiniella umbellata]|nr:F/Y-rich N-terminus-domain-containing protein [Sporodiniella umbellata]